MVAPVGITFKGDSPETILRRFEHLGDRNLRKAMRAAIRKGGSKVAAEMRRSVPRDTGTLKKSIGTKVKTYKPFAIVAVIGPRSKFTQVLRRSSGTKDVVRRPTKYAHLLEHGATVGRGRVRIQGTRVFERAGKAAQAAAFRAYRSKLRSKLIELHRKARGAK